jgi:hypothetical protein
LFSRSVSSGFASLILIVQWTNRTVWQLQ